jgi:hypothetical protein
MSLKEELMVGFWEVVWFELWSLCLASPSHASFFFVALVIFHLQTCIFALVGACLTAILLFQFKCLDYGLAHHMLL